MQRREVSVTLQGRNVSVTLRRREVSGTFAEETYLVLLLELQVELVELFAEVFSKRILHPDHEGLKGIGVRNK